jgi:hypothetical protein
MRQNQFREAPTRGFARHMPPSACQGVAVNLPYLTSHVENESEAFVRVEGVRVEFDRVAEQPPFSRSLSTNILLRSSNCLGAVLILRLERLCNYIAARDARQCHV